MDLGTLVAYYEDGWRYGYLEKVKGKRAHICPIAAYKATRPRLIWVEMASVKEADSQPIRKKQH